jgi:aldehyde:ferredoxin oxidoreductase
MSGGYTGTIARINLTTGAVSRIDTSRYEAWGGGHGIAAALFFDILVKEKGLNLEKIDGFHPDNLTTIMTSPFTGTVVPAAGGRTEIAGMGVHAYPKDWYTKSLVGGRLGPMVKFAGYDGIAIEGAASEPVWLDIRDQSITIRPCSELGLWGKDTVETQKAIWAYVMGDAGTASWYSPEGATGETTQRPAVIAIGRAGETRCRMACLIHESGYAAGAGGFGAVWGAKNLKAVSFVGTGKFAVADPAGVVRERLANLRDYGPKFDEFTAIDRSKNMLRHNFMVGAGEAFGKTPTDWLGTADGTALMVAQTKYIRPEAKRPASCMSCYAGCRGRYVNGIANESHCAGTYFYAQGDNLDIMTRATDLINRYGFNTFDYYRGTPYIKALADKGVIGPIGSGAEIETSLDFSTWGQLKWAEDFLRIIANREDELGDAIADGFYRALERWGRLDDIGDASEEDKAHIPLPYWGLPEHHYDPRCQLEYGYGSILGDREICEHYFTSIFWDSFWRDITPTRGYDATALEAVTLSVEKMLPHASDYDSLEKAQQMMDYSTANMYSEHIVRLVSWHRHYTRFYKSSLLFCDWKYPDIINTNQADKRGSSFTAEEKFIKVVTGKDIPCLEGMKIGKKIWNLDNAIWTLQGRHRDMVYFADYIYRDDYWEPWKMTVPNPKAMYPNRRWMYTDVGPRHLDRTKFDEFKTRFYTYEGWDPATGWPTRNTLESLGMAEIADGLERWGKLGAAK